MPSTASVTAALLFFLSAIPAAAGPVTLLSRADPDRPSETAGGTSEVAGISADGRYVVLTTEADNFLPGVADTNLGRDVFFHDRVAGITVLVSHAAGEPLTAGNGVVLSGSYLDADLSADGRWVAFRSTASNLVPGQVGDGNGSADVFLWDRDTGLNILVSHLPGLPTTDAGHCWDDLDISADGSRVVYASWAPNLVAGQSDDTFSLDVFLYDRAADTNILVSRTSAAAAAAAGGSGSPALSADGNWVVFESDATNLVAGQIDSNATPDLFLYDRLAGSNTLVSHAAGAPTTAAAPADWFYRAQINADGSRVAYQSLATNLVTGQVDGNNDTDVFLYNRASGTNILVSHSWPSGNTSGNYYSRIPSLSADGRYVAFMSGASDLASESTGFWQVVFIFDQVTGTNTLLSGDPSSLSGDATLPRISADGSWVGFLSTATNLVPGQTDKPFTTDVFLWSRISGSLTLLTRVPNSATTTAGSSAKDLRINADGSWIALASLSSGLVDGIGDHNATEDVFLYERATGVSSLLTSRGDAISASVGGRLAVWSGTTMSNDGRFIAFTSAASNIAGATDGNAATDVFLYDRISSAITLVSHKSTSFTTTADSLSFEPLVSSDGSVVVFASFATNLVAGQTGPSPFPPPQLFLYERTSGGITLVSHTAESLSTSTDGGFGGDYAVSGDGRWIAFTSSGSDLIAGQVDVNGAEDIFLFDRATGTNNLISHSNSSLTQTGNGFSNVPSLSTDGRYLAFLSSATDLVPEQGGTGGIFLHDRVAGTTTRVSSSGGSPLRISADGRWLVFTSSATDVVPGQVNTNSASDVFLWDRISGTTQLVSRTSAAPATTGNARSSLGTFTHKPPVLSADGRWVVFTSDADNLVTEPTASVEDVFLFDRVAGTVSLVSRAANWPTAGANERSTEPNISADGRFITYLSRATNLVPGQVDEWGSFDTFLFDRIAGSTSLVSHIPSSEVTSGRSDTGFLNLRESVPTVPGSHSPALRRTSSPTTAMGSQMPFSTPISCPVETSSLCLPAGSLIPAKPARGRSWHLA